MNLRSAQDCPVIMTDRTLPQITQLFVNWDAITKAYSNCCLCRQGPHLLCSPQCSKVSSRTETQGHLVPNSFCLRLEHRNLSALELDKNPPLNENLPLTSP